jgi:hypothetical protein
VPDAPERAIGAVEREVADARVFEQHPRAMGLRIDAHQIAIRPVVGGIEDDVRARIVRERRHCVDGRPFDVDDLVDLPTAARAGRDGADVRQHTGIIERRVDFLIGRIVVRARDRSERPRRDVARRRHGIGADGVEVLPLEVVLVLHPGGPGRRERRPEHVLELRGIVAATAVVARHPLDELLG